MKKKLKWKGDDFVVVLNNTLFNTYLRGRERERERKMRERLWEQQI